MVVLDLDLHTPNQIVLCIVSVWRQSWFDLVDAWNLCILKSLRKEDCEKYHLVVLLLIDKHITQCKVGTKQGSGASDEYCYVVVKGVNIDNTMLDTQKERIHSQR